MQYALVTVKQEYVAPLNKLMFVLHFFLCEQQNDPMAFSEVLPSV